MKKESLKSWLLFFGNLPILIILIILILSLKIEIYSLTLVLFSLIVGYIVATIKAVE